MPKVFISYRRKDTAFVAQSIYDKLAEHYGAESVVFDVDSIPKGFDFVEYLNQQVRKCNVLLVVIGDRWLDVRAADGSRRIDDPNDFVRIEIQAALKQNIPVIPILIGETTMPAETQLPPDLKPLSRRNAAEVRDGRDFQNDLERLVRDVDKSLKHMSRPPERVTPPETETGDDIITNTIGMQLKLLGPGTFLMGESASQHQVTLTEPYRLALYPVTQMEYERVMKVKPSDFKGDERRPVEKVSWFDAIGFCNRLSEQERLPPYYDVEKKKVTILGGGGYRLPTEAEWEYACRAGSDTAYYFGDDERQLDQYAWFLENSKDTTHPVGEKQANAWGLYDMHGNVWEWCWDWYDEDYYRTSPKENPSGPSKGSNRVIRGGGWWIGARYCRAANRRRLEPQFRNDYLGFRVAAVPSSKTS